MHSTFWPNRIFEGQSCQNRQTGLKLSSKREKSALYMKIVQNALLRSCAARFGQLAFVSVKVVKIVTLAWNSLQNGKTVRFPWKFYKTLFSRNAEQVLANRIFEGQSSENRHTRLKFSSKRENSALFMKIVQNALFRSCAARFAQVAFLRVKLLKIVTLVSNSLQNEKTVRFSWKLYKTLFSGFAQHVLAKSHFWALKFSKSSHWRQLLAKTLKQCAFQESCTKRSFQVMRSTFWPNRIFERQSCQNRHTGLNFSSKRENSALSIKFVQNVPFRSCAACFGKSHFWGSKFWKSSHSPEILFKKGKQCAFHENCTKRSFQIMRNTFSPSRIFEGQSSENRHTRLKFSSKRENSALFMKIVQNALFRSCAARFGQIAFLGVKLLKVVTLVSNSLQNGKTVRFPWKLYKTFFLGHAQHVLAKSHLWASKLSKSSNWHEIVLETGKECTLHENCTKRSFEIMLTTFWPNRICERQSGENCHTGLKFSSKRENSALSMKILQNALFT